MENSLVSKGERTKTEMTQNRKFLWPLLIGLCRRRLSIVGMLASLFTFNAACAVSLIGDSDEIQKR
jgi:hypothetical protein